MNGRALHGVVWSLFLMSLIRSGYPILCCVALLTVNREVYKGCGGCPTRQPCIILSIYRAVCLSVYLPACLPACLSHGTSELPDIQSINNTINKHNLLTTIRIGSLLLKHDVDHFPIQPYHALHFVSDHCTGAAAVTRPQLYAESKGGLQVVQQG